MDNFTLLGVCGLYCGACYHYRASFEDGQHLLEEAVRKGKDAEGFTCRGCRSDDLYIHSGCKDCKIRACAEERGILHCGLCEEVPCSRLKNFRDDGHLHHLDVIEKLEELKKKDPEKWLEEQEKKWQCEGCGRNYSWYETTCIECGAELDSYAEGE